jgi:hypothetical protein
MVIYHEESNVFTSMPTILNTHQELAAEQINSSFSSYVLYYCILQAALTTSVQKTRAPTECYGMTRVDSD